MAAGWLLFLLILLGVTSPSRRKAGISVPIMVLATSTDGDTSTPPNNNNSLITTTTQATPSKTKRPLYWRPPTTPGPTLSPEAAAFMSEIFKLVTCRSIKCTPENSVPPSYGVLHRCQCDEECNLLGECCPQMAPSRPLWKQPTAPVHGVERRYWGCSVLQLNATTNVSISMVTRCPKGHVLGKLCARHVAPKHYDYKLDLPVLNGETGVWFQNVFCAVCHGCETSLRKQFLSFACVASNNTQLEAIPGAPFFSKSNFNSSHPRSIAQREALSTFDNTVDTDGSFETEYAAGVKGRKILNDSLTAARKHDDTNYYYVFKILQQGTYEAGKLLWSINGSSCHLYPELPPPTKGLDAVPWERPCMQLVDNCPVHWEGDKEVADLCGSYSYHVVGSKTYKNPHCAICNNETVTLKCRKNVTTRKFDFRQPVSLRLVMDYEWNPGRDVCSSSGGVWDALHSRCQSLDEVCPRGTRYTGGRCINVLSPGEGGSGHNSSTGRDSHDGSGDPRDLDGDDDDGVPLNDTCLRITLEPGEFALESNGSLRLTLAGSPFFGLVLQPGEFRLLGDGRAQVCNDYQYVLMPTDTVQGYMTVVCLAVSAVCLVLHLIVHALLPKLHNLPGKNLQALSVALLLGQLGFLLGVSPPGPVPAALCEAIAVAVHFFYLAAFCWMNVMSVDIWRTFSVAIGRTTANPSATHRRYAAYAWGLPAAVVALSLAADHTPGFPQYLRPGYAEAGICWFGSGSGLGYYLALPVTFILIGNMALFVVTVFQLQRRQEGSRYLRRRRRDECNEGSARGEAAPAPAAARGPAAQCTGPRDLVRFWLYLKLFIIMGVSWLMGTLAVLARWPALWYPFVVLNGLQGAFIFVMFDVKRSVLGMLWERLLGPRPPPALLRSPRSTPASDSSRRTATTTTATATATASSSPAGGSSRVGGVGPEQCQHGANKNGTAVPDVKGEGAAKEFQQPVVDAINGSACKSINKG